MTKETAKGANREETTRLRWNRIAKRSLDYLIGVPALLVAFPFLLIAAVIIVVIDRHSPFFADRRIGLGGREFYCLKLQTMHSGDTATQLLETALHNPDEAERYRLSRKLTHDPRITRLGRVLRKTSVDELPQIFNVLKGDMSLVGPRPIPEEELVARGRYARFLLDVRPGLTGLWQVRGRTSLSQRSREACDWYYARHWNLVLDLQILA